MPRVKQRARREVPLPVAQPGFEFSNRLAHRVVGYLPAHTTAASLRDLLQALRVASSRIRNAEGNGGEGVDDGEGDEEEEEQGYDGGSVSVVQLALSADGTRAVALGRNGVNVWRIASCNTPPTTTTTTTAATAAAAAAASDGGGAMTGVEFGGEGAAADSATSEPRPAASAVTAASAVAAAAVGDMPAAHAGFAAAASEDAYAGDGNAMDLGNADTTSSSTAATSSTAANIGNQNDMQMLVDSGQGALALAQLRAERVRHIALSRDNERPSMALSADGGLLYLLIDSGTLQVWDTATGALLRAVELPRRLESQWVTGSLLLSEDDAVLLVRLECEPEMWPLLLLLSAATLRPLHTLACGTDGATVCTMSGDGSCVAYAMEASEKLRVWRQVSASAAATAESAASGELAPASAVADAAAAAPLPAPAATPASASASASAPASAPAPSSSSSSSSTSCPSIMSFTVNIDVRASHLAFTPDTRHLIVVGDSGAAILDGNSFAPSHLLNNHFLEGAVLSRDGDCMMVPQGLSNANVRFYNLKRVLSSDV